MKAAAAALLTRLTGSRFRRNAFLLVRANVLTQAALLLATPILTRLFAPQDFGIAGLFVISSALFTAVASWRFEWSIPSARSDEDAKSLTLLSLLLIAAAAMLLQFVFLVASQEALFGLVGMDPIPFAALFPLFAFITSATAVLSAAHVRARIMDSVAHSRYASSGTQLAVSLATGIAGMGAFGLVLAYTLAAAAGALMMLRSLPLRIATRLVDAARTGRRYLSQASLSTAVSLVNFAFSHGLPFLLLFGYSVREVGFYFVAMRLAGGPMGLLSEGISSSFWGEAAVLARTDPAGLRRLYLKVVARLALMFLPIAAGCLAAPLFLPALLGEREWSEIGIVMAACVPQVAGMFIFSSTNHLIVYGRQGYQLVSDLLSIAGSIVVLLLAKAWELPFAAAILSFSCIILFAYLLRFLFHLKANRETVRAFSQL